MKEIKFPSREEMIRRLHAEDFKRITLSFYRYVKIEDPEQLRISLMEKWKPLKVFGRIYLAFEGINAQMSVPETNLEDFKSLLYSDPKFTDIPFKIAVEDDGKSFYKLTIKVRSKIVADGLKDDSFDVTNVGRHLNAEEWNKAMDDPNAVIVDMRNFYESEIGHFENAICPEAHSFRQELPMTLDLLKGKEDKKVLLYCTGGIRCEKASAFLKHHGFRDVNQLYGGIIDYARQVKSSGLPSRFKGKNFVFDERMGERITEDVIGKCYQCGSPCDTHRNCENNGCHLLFIQCENCRKNMEGCCSDECREILRLPEAEQKKIRQETASDVPTWIFSSRRRIKKSQ